MTLEWSTSCEDWEERIRDGQSLIPCPPLFPAEAEAALDIFRELRIVDAPGSPRIGEVCKPWVLDFAAAIFGSYDPDAGRRLINKFFLLGVQEEQQEHDCSRDYANRTCAQLAYVGRVS